MNKRKIIIIASCGIVIILGLVLGFTLGNSGPEPTPGKKVMAETKAYLMEMQRLLNDRGEPEIPLLCDCCDTPLVNGECPFCRGACDQSGAAGMRRFETIQDAPVTHVETDGDNPPPPDHGEQEENNYSINEMYK